MANRTWQKIQALNQGLIILVFSFLPAGSSAPTGVSGRGIASVVRDSAGVFIVTLEDTYQELMGCDMTIMMAAGTDISPQLEGEDVAGAGTVTIRTVVAEVETDIAADPDNRVFVTLTLRNSSVT